MALRHVRFAIASMLGAWITACPSPPGSSPPPDAGVDAGTDAGLDAGVDAGVVLCPGFIDGGQRFDAGSGVFSPVIAWSYAPSGFGEIYLKRWNGSSWEELDGSATDGGVSRTPTYSTAPSVAIGPDGNPSVAWAEYLGANIQIYFRHWNGSSWEEWGASATDGGISGEMGTDKAIEPRLVVDHLGRATVAWEHVATIDSVKLRRWNGCVWEDLGGSASSTPFGSPSWVPSLALDPQDRPVMSWRPPWGSCAVAVARWNDVRWEAFGNSLDDGGIDPNMPGGDPTVAVGPDGNLFVARNPSASGASGFLVERFGGTSWTPIASTSGMCFAGAPFPMAIGDGGEPVVAWWDDSNGAPLQTFAWTGGGWQQLGTLPKGDLPSLTSDARGVVEAWLGYADAGYQIYALQWDGAAWQELGGSGSRAGITNYDGGAYGPGIGGPAAAGWNL